MLNEELTPVAQGRFHGADPLPSAKRLVSCTTREEPRSDPGLFHLGLTVRRRSLALCRAHSL